MTKVYFNLNCFFTCVLHVTVYTYTILRHVDTTTKQRRM